MKIASLAACLLTSSLPVTAQQAVEKTNFVEALLTAKDKAEFQQTLNKAKAAGFPAQSQLEARFLFHVDRQDFTALSKLSKELVAYKDRFDSKQSAIFTLEEDWLAIVHYTQALEALENKQNEVFKEHILKAFWLSPKQANIFAPHIEKLRLDQAMAKLELPPTMALPELFDKSDTLTLAQLTKKKKAVILHFWSPWSSELAISFSEFKASCKEAKKNDIAIASILIEQGEEVHRDGRSFVKENNAKRLCYWLCDPADSSLSRQLRVQSVPTVVLLSPEGKVLFNGHPTDDDFWKALKDVAPGFTRPSVEEDN